MAGAFCCRQFNRQSSGLRVLRIVFQPPRVHSKASSCISSSAKFLRWQTRNLGTPAPVWNPHHHAVIDNGPTAAAVRGPEYFPVNWLTDAMFKPLPWPAFQAGG
jgi:hypothetical protein